MGCDGGTIPRRDELVRTKKKPEQKDKASELSFRWQHCAISQERLRTPIVACGLGRLYSKDVVIEALLERSNLPEIAQHIKNMKDIKDLRLTPNPAFKASIEKGDGYVDRQAVPFVCPVIGLEMNGKFRFVFLWGCGCVVSERALKEVKTRLCHKCQRPFSDEDVVVLNGTDEDLLLMGAKVEARRARARAEKRARQGGRLEGGASTSAPSAGTSAPSAGTSAPSAPKPGQVGARLPGRDSAKAAKRGANGDIKDPLYKKTKGEYSIAKDPQATDVFKSLFTSHPKAHGQTKAHWVTYNPFYN